jgi:hypothetical protein
MQTDAHANNWSMITQFAIIQNFIQGKDFAHKLPLFDDGKILARCVILPLSLCISVSCVNICFLPLCQHQKEEPVSSRQYVSSKTHQN